MNFQTPTTKTVSMDLAYFRILRTVRLKQYISS